MNKLTHDIFNTLYLDNWNKNFCFSPASLIGALNTLCLCLKNDNLSEILEKLSVKEDELIEYIKFYKEFSGLDTFDSLLYSKEYEAALNNEVTAKIKELNIELESFNDSSVINRINSLVEQKTNGKIKGLLKPDDFNDFTKFIILNCVYFKKDWLWQFEESNFKHKMPFYGIETTQIEYLVPEQHRYNYYENNELDIVEIPYKGSDICCYLFIPQNQTINNLVSNFQDYYSKIHLLKSDIDVNLTVPEFKVESEFRDLVKHMGSAGINKIFNWSKDWELVNFDKLLPETVLAVSSIIQKCYFDFNKKGVEAAAATAMIIVCSGCLILNSPPPKIKYIRADKSFVYVLANKDKKDVPLFIGIINKL